MTRRATGALGLAAVIALSLACAKGGHGATPPPANPLPNAAVLSIEAFDAKTGAAIQVNERDYPLHVTIDVKNHEQESATGFPLRFQVIENPWRHTVTWPQTEEFDLAEAMIEVPLLAPGVRIACHWQVPGSDTQGGPVEFAVPNGHAPGIAGMQCIITAAMMRR